jgi:hypothetical protein
MRSPPLPKQCWKGENLREIGRRVLSIARIGTEMREGGETILRSISARKIRGIV